MKMTSKKLRKGPAPKTMKTAGKTIPTFGDSSSKAANMDKKMKIKKAVAQKDGYEGTSIKNAKKSGRQDRMKRLAGVKF